MKCANIFPYIRRPLGIYMYDFATAPFWISSYMMKFDFLFLSVQMSDSDLHVGPEETHDGWSSALILINYN